MKTEEQQRARELRALGWSVRQIAQELAVSRSSASVWVRDVPLGPEQRAELIRRARLGPIVSGERKAAAARERRAAWQDEGRRRASSSDAAYAAGCMLFWAEGSRRRNTVHLTNSDPDLVVMFLRFLRSYFEVPDDRIALTCNLFADHAEQQHEVEQHWLDRLDLPRSCLRKSTVNVYSKYSQKKRINKLPYGTARLTVHDTRIVQTIYGSIQEYGEFDRPAWLD